MKAWALMVVALLAGACGPTSVPAADFTLNVTPPEQPVAVRAAIPGQHTSFLVSIADASDTTATANVSATATAATVDRIAPSAIKAGQVAEVWLTIDPAITTESTASVTITVSRGERTHATNRTIDVMPASSEGRERDAAPHFDFWIGWLAANHPELKITSATVWQPEFVSILLVVSHMSYFSTDWELSLMWHAGTIPPYDWSQVYLRKRGSETKPSLAFKVDSFSAHTSPYSVTPPEVVVR